MAKQTGLGDYIAVDDSGGSARDISDNITNYDIAIAQNLIDATTISKSAMEKLIGLNDLTVTLTGVFDSASNKEHDVFKVRSAARTFDLRIGGNTSSNPRLTAEMMISDYSLSRGTDGSLGFTATLNLSNGTTPTWDTVP
jgi:hypothetical protein